MAQRHLSTTWIVGLALVVMVLWSLLVGYSLYWNIQNLGEENTRLATAEARSNWNKDMAFRGWASRHGGVYVRPDERTPPNPYLSHLPQRDVTLEDGTELTLMNPAYMMRQMIEEYEESYGIKGKATGLTVINPKSRPDEWEERVLQRFTEGEQEVAEEVAINGAPYVRYMKALTMEQSCRQCHGVAELRPEQRAWGVSIAIPLLPYIAAAQSTERSITLAHAAVWLISLWVILIFSAVVWRRQNENEQLLERISHEALHDELTGLPNRQLFLDRVDQALARRQRDREYHFAVCFVDLDRFKVVNDSYGHQMGDRILAQLATRLLHCVRPSDTVARMSGDEFTLLLESTDTLEETLSVVERVLEVIREAVTVDGVTTHTDASIGICCASDDYTSGEELVRDADTAMYRAKDEGKGRIEFFNPQMHLKAITLMRMENDLHQALERGELQLYYQPVIDSHKNTIGGFEVLLRWYHPQMGTISPAEFIPLAEVSGLICKIGAWVLEQACLQVHEWNQHYGERFFVSVNFSGRQIDEEGIVDTVRQALSRSGLAPQLLHCEVTETILMRHQQRAATVLEALQQLGVHISIDDFGTGYSSLTYLHQFSFDILKIDRSFVQDMGAAGKGLQLVRTLMMLAQDFNMEVIAEGVETEEQYERLKALHCYWIQGFYFMRPVPREVVVRMLDGGHAGNIQALIGWEMETGALA